MCAGYELSVDAEAIARAFRAEVQPDLPNLVPQAARSLSLFDSSLAHPRARFDDAPPRTVIERFPRQLGYIVIARRQPDGPPERILCAARFGLVPHFAKSLSVGDKLYNARSETVHQRAAFRAAFAKRRCLVPVSAFFEWQKTAGKARRHAFRPRHGGLLALAGIWETWRAPDGQKVGSFAILTTAASPLVAPIHDRMPVILPAATHASWLSAATSETSLRGLIVPVDEALLEAVPG